MEHLFRFIIGGAVITLISFAAESKNTLLAGLISVFPIMFSTGLLMVGSSSGMDIARSLAGSMAASIPILLIFCGVFYVASFKLSLYPTLAISISAWFIAACAYLWIGNHYS